MTAVIDSSSSFLQNLMKMKRRVPKIRKEKSKLNQTSTNKLFNNPAPSRRFSQIVLHGLILCSVFQWDHPPHFAQQVISVFTAIILHFLGHNLKPCTYLWGICHSNDACTHLYKLKWVSLFAATENKRTRRRWSNKSDLICSRTTEEIRFQESQMQNQNFW